MGKRLAMLGAGVMVLAAAGFGWGQRVATPPAAAPVAPPASLILVRDEEVDKAIKQAVEYLLTQKGDKNFETAAEPNLAPRLMDAPPPPGAQTGLALLALLQAGQSLGDPRLKADSKELAPAVAYLTKLEPQATMSAAMQIAALTLLPRTRETDAAINRAREFLDATTGLDGGHGMGWARSIDNRDIEEAWAEYYDARNPKENSRESQARFNRAKTRLDDVLRQSRLMTEGMSAELARLTKIIKDRDPKAPGAAQKRNGELRDLGAYQQDMNSITAPPYNNQDVSTFKSLLADIERSRKAGPGADALALLNEQAETVDRMLAKAEYEIAVRARPQGNIVDSSFATLAYAALAGTGLDARQNTWALEDRYWHLTQTTEGNWGYWPDGAVLAVTQRASTSAAALASMLAQADAVDAPPRADKALDKALAWLDSTFTVSNDPFYLYNVERIGMSTGRRAFNGTPWFAAGARQLVGSQQKDGSWRGDFMYASPVTASSYALLFLTRGRSPLVFNKLEYKGTWNTRPKDAAGLAAWMTKKLERGFTWQSVKLDDGADVLNEAPLLLITGSRDPKFTPEEIARLRNFIQAGGLIVSSADNNSAEFTGAMKKAAGQMIDGQTDMKLVDDKADIFNSWQPLKRRVGAWTLSNGLRVVWVHAETDWGGTWLKKTNPQEVFEAGTNLYSYATSLVVKSRLETRMVEPGPATVGRKLAVARVKYAGNWDPEPAAWPRFVALAKARFNTAITLTPVDLAALDAKATPVAHLTGFGKQVFTAADTAAVQKYVAAGGVLIVDAAGGDADFATAARGLIKDALKAVPEDVRNEDAIYSGYIGLVKDGKKLPDAVPIPSVTYRPYVTKVNKSPSSTPHLKKVVVGAKISVVFSAEDISSGFLGTSTWGNLGYSPESSVTLMRNILLNAAAGR